jgi:hypothetical protein
MANYMNPQYPGYGMQYSPAQQRLAQMEQMYPQYADRNAMGAQMSVPMQNVTWIPVSGVQGAKDHIVQPGMTAWLMDNNDTIFYVKASDNLGVTTLKAYRFAEISMDAPQAQSAVDPAQFVSREEFEQLKNQIEQMTGRKPEKEANNG